MDLTPEAQRLAVIVATVIVLWFSEALPLAVTALLGCVACVVLGVAPAKEVFRPFADPIIFLFIGSFLLAEAIRIHRLDRRLAYGVLAVPWVGERPVRILAAVAFVSILTSSFISNTVTAAMMLAIVSGIMSAVEDSGREGSRPAPSFATGLFLCIAFAASIGGLATPIGTPTNLIGLGFLRTQLGVSVSFLGWCAICLPVVAILGTILVAVLARLFPAGIDRLEGVTAFVAQERRRLGGWTTGQRSTAVAFGLTVVLWLLPGILLAARGPENPATIWLRERLPEGVASLIGAILLFVLPGDRGKDGRRPRAVAWRDTRIDWEIVLLYGGGLALGELCFSTGLAAAAGRGITGWIPEGPWGGPALVAVSALVAVVTSEFTSNVASSTMVVPIVIALGQATGVAPAPAAVAATLAASLGFMMPVSSPCNAIVYSSGRIPMRSMMIAGVLLDLVGVFVITLAVLIAARSIG